MWTERQKGGSIQRARSPTGKSLAHHPHCSQHAGKIEFSLPGTAELVPHFNHSHLAFLEEKRKTFPTPGKSQAGICSGPSVKR